MNKLVPITIAIILLCSCIATADPQIKIEDSHFDFGVVPQNAKVSHKFWVKSVGVDDLKILKVIPGCGCTKAPLEKDIVSPGDSTWLEIIFSTKKYKSKVTKRPKILTNASTTEERVSFSAIVTPDSKSTYPLLIEPAALDLSKRKQGEDISLTFTNLSDKKLSIDVISSADDYFTTTLPKFIEPGGKAIGTLHMVAGSDNIGNLQLVKSMPRETFAKSFTIELDDKNKTRFTIPVVRNSSVIVRK